MSDAPGTPTGPGDGAATPAPTPPDPGASAPASASTSAPAAPHPDSRLAIHRLADAGRPPAPEVIDAFFAEHRFPVIEGPSVTFVFRGQADQVNVRHFVFGLPASQPLDRLEGTDVWFQVVEIPPGSRVEYKIEVVRGGHGEWIKDPLNPFSARDPFGANSVVQGEGYVTPEWTKPDPESRDGTLEEMWIDSAALGHRKHIRLYLPARFRRTRRYPLLVVHDGPDYLEYASMKNVLDNLIHRLEIPELVVAFSRSDDRLREYANDERHARFLTEELVPHLEKSWPLTGRPAGRCLMGASFGAVAAFSTAWRHPGFYGRLLLQSGSFAFTDIGRRNHRGPLFDPVVDFVNAYRRRPLVVAERVYVSCGIYESLIYENRSLLPLLQATGMEIRYTEARDGHNWENWRDRLREGLSWLFPGPLLMVYE